MKIAYYPTILIFLLAACESREPEISLNGSDTEIKVLPGIGDIQVDTRGNGIITNTLTTDLAVSAIRVDQSGTTPAYPANLTGVTAKNATVNKSSRVMTFDAREYYLLNDNKTKVLAWYPRTGSLNASTGKVSFSAIDGSTDILASGWGEGNRTTPIAAGSIVLRHMLTRITVKVYAETTEAKTWWGNVSAVTITNARPNLEVTLPAISTSDQASKATATSTGTARQQAIVYKTLAGATISTPVAPGIGSGNAVMMGYSMFPPHTYTTSGSELTLSVVTTGGGTKSIKIAQSLEMGTSYEVMLKMTLTEIQPTIQIEEWKAGGTITVPM